VSQHKVVQITYDLEAKYDQVIFLNYDDIFDVSDMMDDNKILSSAMSKDFEYLILGTSRGIIAIDRFDKRILFRRNVSDQVISLDVFRYPEDAFCK